MSTSPTSDAAFSFVATPAAPSAARAALVEFARRLPYTLGFDLRLLVTELVAHRVLYGSLAEEDTIDLQVSAGRGRIRVSTLDCGTAIEPGRPQGWVLGGSLQLVDALADGWGVERVEDGTRVWFELQVDDEARGASAPPGRATGERENAVRVVIAEDYRLFAETLAARLELDAHIRVVGIAEDGVELVELVRELEPDVALVDMMMPRIDGLEAAVRIRASGAQTVVAVMSGHDDVTDEVHAAGADAFVTKDDLARDPVDIVLRLAAPDVATADGSERQGAPRRV